MRKTLSKIITISIIGLSVGQITFADAVSNNNLDKIEKVGYFHSSLFSGGTCGGGAGDWRFKNSGSSGFSKYTEFKSLFDNIDSNLSCLNVSIGILNNTPQKQDKNQFGTIYSEADGTYYTSPEKMDRTGSGEYMLMPSKYLMTNLSKNPLFSKDKGDAMEIKKDIQSDMLKGKQIKMIGRYFKVKGTYEFNNFVFGVQKADLNLDIMIVDDISLVSSVTTTIKSAEIIGTQAQKTVVDNQINNKTDTKADTADNATQNTTQSNTTQDIRKNNIKDTGLQNAFNIVDNAVDKIFQNGNTTNDPFDGSFSTKIQGIRDRITIAKSKTKNARKLQLLDYIESKINEKYGSDPQLGDIVNMMK